MPNTQLIFFDHKTITLGQYTNLTPNGIDVSPYQAIRVVFSVRGDPANPVWSDFTLTINSGLAQIAILDRFEVVTNNTTTRSYDVPGQNISIFVSGRGTGLLELYVFGH